jgi:sugar/nucleoside kinase (ribokinase family)
MRGPPLDLLAIGAINIDYVTRRDEWPSTAEEWEIRVDEEHARRCLCDPYDAWSFGGSAFNTIRIAARLNAGLRLGFVGVFGEGDEGSEVAKELDYLSREFRLSQDFIKREDGPLQRPGACFATVWGKTGTRSLETHEFSNRGMADWLNRLRSERLDEITNARIIHITSLLDDASADSLGLLVDALSASDARPVISFDPGHVWIEGRADTVTQILEKTDILFVNEGELVQLAGRRGALPSTDIAEVVLQKMRHTSKIIVLKSAAKVTCFSISGGACVPYDFPHPKLSADRLFNPVGTGDAMAAGYLTSLLTQSSLLAPVALGQGLAAAKLKSTLETNFEAALPGEYRAFSETFDQRPTHDFDVALSFAGEQREFAQELAAAIKNLGLKVFYDNDYQADLWGRNLYDYLFEIYSRRAKYCLIVVSKEYAAKEWTVHERQAAQHRALAERGNAYILPVQYDDSVVPSLPKGVGHLKASDGAEKIARDLAGRLSKSW